MIKGSSGHFLDFTNRELGDLAWLTGAIYLEQNRFPNTIFSRQCFLLIEDEDIRNKVSLVEFFFDFEKNKKNNIQVGVVNPGTLIRSFSCQRFIRVG